MTAWNVVDLLCLVGCGVFYLLVRRQWTRSMRPGIERSIRSNEQLVENLKINTSLMQASLDPERFKTRGGSA